jgi:hypothetical protein
VASTDYATNVFINCPFDKAYLELCNALLFAVFDCGFVPRCALEEDNSGNVRFEKILNIIAESKFAIHDISRTEIDAESQLPRFNMPLELGVFIGAKKFGDRKQKNKNCLIFDREQYRYQAFISDIAGNDIRAHNNDPEEAIKHVRNWLNDASGRKTIPGGRQMLRRYSLFKDELPAMCVKIPIEIDELTYNDYCNFISTWLKENSN